MIQRNLSSREGPTPPTLLEDETIEDEPNEAENPVRAETRFEESPLEPEERNQSGTTELEADEDPDARNPPDEELIDSDLDPLQNVETTPNSAWLKEVLAIEPRSLPVPPAENLRKKVYELIDDFRSGPEEPSPPRIQELERALEELHKEIPDHEEFVASSFQLYLPAWRALLEKSSRRSARTILSWLEHGFRPRFGGITEAKPEKRRVVELMLAKTVGQRRITWSF